eukprot:6487952-Alexandrium_andersonii.AAC.1
MVFGDVVVRAAAEDLVHGADARDLTASTPVALPDLGAFVRVLPEDRHRHHTSQHCSTQRTRRRDVATKRQPDERNLTGTLEP